MLNTEICTQHSRTQRQSGHQTQRPKSDYEAVSKPDVSCQNQSMQKDGWIWNLNTCKGMSEIEFREWQEEGAYIN